VLSVARPRRAAPIPLPIYPSAGLATPARAWSYRGREAESERDAARFRLVRVPIKNMPGPFGTRTWPKEVYP